MSKTTITADEFRKVEELLAIAEQLDVKERQVLADLRRVTGEADPLGHCLDAINGLHDWKAAILLQRLGLEISADVGPAHPWPTPTILEQIDLDIRAAGGSLPWQRVSTKRPNEVSPHVFRSMIEKRFDIRRRGRGECVLIKEAQS